jgi:DNA-binding NarL/FixJ family response regulator
MFTGRESEVLSLMAEGLSSKEIACRMGICESTVITHRKSILRKLEAKNSSE